MSTLRGAKYLVNRYLLRRPYLMARASLLDLRFRVKTEDVIGRHIYKYGMHEPDNTRLIRSLVQLTDGDVAFDIGANIGWYSMLLDRLATGSDVRIYSFEPDPLNFRLLQENIRMNAARHVLARQCAASDTGGVMKLHLFEDSNRGRHSMLPIHAGECVDVETARLDDFWDEQGLDDRVPRFIKIDIEGYELIALRGAEGILRRCPLLMLEFSPAYMRAGGIEPSDLIGLLTGLGLHPRFVERGELRSTSRSELLALERNRDLIWTRDAG